MSTVSIDQQFVEYVVKSIVGNQDAVKVDRSVDEKGVLLELTVDPEDLGRVIGKRGATAQSLRTLLRALGTKNEARYNLKIVDNGAPRPARSDDSPATSTSDDDDVVSNDDVADEAEVEAPKETKSSESMASKARKELDDLDDLDI
ncbi:KH domain-containing protein [Candidatus Saccharibacteria bacterium]|nr:KH domain-containing protein [Candidatus Saccharibacteria bacterium]